MGVFDYKSNDDFVDDTDGTHLLTTVTIIWSALHHAEVHNKIKGTMIIFGQRMNAVDFNNISMHGSILFQERAFTYRDECCFASPSTIP